MWSHLKHGGAETKSGSVFLSVSRVGSGFLRSRSTDYEPGRLFPDSFWTPKKGFHDSRGFGFQYLLTAHEGVRSQECRIYLTEY